MRRRLNATTKQIQCEMVFVLLMHRLGLILGARHLSGAQDAPGFGVYIDLFGEVGACRLLGERFLEAGGFFFLLGNKAEHVGGRGGNR